MSEDLSGGPASPESVIPAFGDLLTFTGDAIDSGLTRLETANSWVLTVSLGASIVLATSERFPSEVTQVLLSGAIGLTAHFLVRAAKGYINVMRYGSLNRKLGDMAIANQGDLIQASESFKVAFRDYHLDWRLPIRRRDVWIKAFTEFSFGYVYLGLFGLWAYNLSQVNVSGVTLVASILLMLLGVFEVLFFHFRSPYMREGETDARSRLQL